MVKSRDSVVAATGGERKLNKVRGERLAKALRENLKKRKDQARARNELTREPRKDDGGR